jgi:hypothetical protein
MAMIEPQFPGNVPPLGCPLRPLVVAFFAVPAPPEARLLVPFGALFFTPANDLPTLPDPLRRYALPFLAVGAFDPPRGAVARDAFALFGTAGPSCVI